MDVREFDGRFFAQGVLPVMIMNDWSEEERRRQERFSLECYLKVIDADTEALLGHIEDISTGGMKLLSSEPIPTGQDFRLLLEISLGDDNQARVLVEARSIWTLEDINPGFHNTGFCFLGLSSRAEATISNLMAALSAE